MCPRTAQRECRTHEAGGKRGVGLGHRDRRLRDVARRIANLDDDLVAERARGGEIQVGIRRPIRDGCALASASHRPFD